MKLGVVPKLFIAKTKLIQKETFKLNNEIEIKISLFVKRMRFNNKKNRVKMVL